MNLYNYHSNPSHLIGYDVAFNLSPELAWEKYYGNIVEMKKREYLWKRDGKYSYWYAVNVIKGRFPEGEAAIATRAIWSYHYAKYVLKGRFLEGEKSIQMNIIYLFDYNNFIKSL